MTTPASTMPETRSVADVLRAGLALIEDPEHWATGAFARDARGLSCGADTPQAVCWCSYGALDRAGGPTDERFEAARVLKTVIGSEALSHFNDTHTHAEVVAVWRKAIELAEAAA